MDSTNWGMVLFLEQKNKRKEEMRVPTAQNDAREEKYTFRLPSETSCRNPRLIKQRIDIR